MTYKEARVYLDKASKYGSVLGLDTIRGLLDELGNPQDDLEFIHIAGTNGKGSVLAYISTILSEAGIRTGRYISPSVNSYLEKIQTDGREIPEDVFTELVEEVKKAIARMETKGAAHPTVFEIETAIAFLYFKREACRIVVLETGLGGLLDATNIVKTTKMAVFSTISRDHTGILGDTLKEIAKTKAGIIKPGCVVVSAPQEAEVQAVLEERAALLHCPVIFAEPEELKLEKESWKEQRFSYKWLRHAQISLAGRFQIINAATAVEAADLFLQKEYKIPKEKREEIIRRGLENTRWPGRFTCIAEHPAVIVDGAHNEDAAIRLRETVEAYFPGKKLIFIMGVFKDKEYGKIAKIMAPLAKQIYTVELPDRQRSLAAEELKHVLELYCGRDCNVTVAGTPEHALESALDRADREDVILVFGSLSYLGRIMSECAKRNKGDKK